MAIERTLDAETQSAVDNDWTAPIHLVQLDLPGGEVYLSEGREIVYAGKRFLEGRVKVSELRWGGDGSQSCSIAILNEDGFAAALILNNQIADSVITIWTTHLKADGNNTPPVLYATGSCDGAELTAQEARIPVTTSKFRTAFFPNYYMGSAGFTQIPPEGAVVFWNSTAYLLERESE